MTTQNIIYYQKDGWNLLFLKLLQPSVCHADKQNGCNDFNTFFKDFKEDFIERIRQNRLTAHFLRSKRNLVFHLTSSK